MTGPAPLGEVLRRLRKASRLTQAELAVRVGTGASHLSRIESGERQDVGRDLLERLGKALGAPFELASAAGRLPASTEAAIAGYPRALSAPGFDRRTTPALRRLDAVPVAEALLNRTPGSTTAEQVDTVVLCRSFRCQPQTAAAASAPPLAFLPGPARAPVGVVINPRGERADAELVPRTRFLQAHAAAHLDSRRYDCALPVLNEHELRLIDVTCALLAPRHLLERAVAVGTRLADDLWGASGAAVVEDVAGRLAIPAWVAVRRLADEGVLDGQALYEAMPGSAA
jgi:transcriptional regulator with XRE-family HTH domain